MNQLVLFGADVVAVSVLVFALFFRRHRRRDLVTAYLGVNVGVLAVASALSTGTMGAGLGLGLFGVLSIIRLRSTELDQLEVAYYFSALALGLLGGLTGGPLWLPPTLMALILLVMLVADHPRLLRRYHQQLLVLDGAITEPLVLVARLEQLLGARVHSTSVQRLDLVNDTTTVEVRYELRGGPAGATRATLRTSAHVAPRTGAAR
ncbi:DUF4956 domain-containing protein [Cellulomonas chitinilytica]|uniref:DUF4956 domain-containing protein n=1 Tax=Cellulomonas chitinilytica TaxID=398759 RepID=A0A919P6V2_9CELL|nr:DUF4956 domain-containing protein [Cellulomonas chitinilytica]GIG22414.1 DUF4956 domain-containing protein [Cellulomonas chitinilytica]